ncbi:MAG: SAM-dependent methyltransferase, partial [Deltaproteobacteria bacterium]
TRRQGAAFLLSDPYSWSEDAAREEDWLGGQRSGPYTQKGRDHIRRLLEGEGRILQPAWTCEEEGHVWWTLRTHANHYESIRSCYIRARR